MNLTLKPRVLVACESSGAIRGRLRALGIDAVSCDLLPADDGEKAHHFQDDVRELLHYQWDAVIAHPPCTYLAASGLHWNKRRPERAALTEEALAFARMFIDGPETAHVPLVAVENPIGCISTRIRRPDCIVQPWYFGDDASKATCWWLRGFPALTPTNVLRKERYANQTASGQNRLPPSPDRWKLRSATYAGMADAIVAQWSPLIWQAWARRFQKAARERWCLARNASVV